MLLLPLAGFVTSAFASALPHVVVESRSSAPPAWKRSGIPLDPLSTFQLSLGLAQQNLHRLDAELMAVSDPMSKSYGKHWTSQEIVDFFAPSEETASSVESWLVRAKIQPSRHAVSANKAWIKVNVTISEAENLLKAQYFSYKHENGHMTLGCESYSVPSHLREHIEIIAPTLHFDAPQRTERHIKRTPSPALGLGSVPGAVSLGNIVSPLKGLVAPLRLVTPSEAQAPALKPETFRSAAPDGSAELQNCSQKSTPLCLKTLYGYESYQIVGNERNAYAIAEFFPQSYVASDLDQFFEEYNSALVGVRPTLFSIDEGFINDTFQSFGYNGESNLDIGIAMTQIYPLNVSLYQVGSAELGGDFNNLLDAIDGDYCTYEGGDDSVQDPHYQNPDCGTVPRPSVISSSYAFNEGDLTVRYETRQCDEFGKLGLLGTTILYSSGDFGVGGAGGTCYTEGTTDYSPDGTKFNPSFPATCPYATGVGATQIKEGKTIYDPDPEQACYQYIYSAGGFSNVFATPDYQKPAIAKYYEDNSPPYSASIYNNSQQVRGFPDLSANGAFYPVVVNGSDSLLFGTSASSPLIGGIITLINDARIAAGKSTVGFINPSIYSVSFAAAFNEITVGSNPGCNGAGFNATAGWNPVTGLGTPKVAKLMELFVALP